MLYVHQRIWIIRLKKASYRKSFFYSIQVLLSLSRLKCQVLIPSTIINSVGALVVPVLKVTFNFLPAPITASVKYLVCEEAAASPALIQPDFVTVAVALPVTLIPEVLVSLKVALLAVTLPPLVENAPAAIVNFAYLSL